MNRFRRTLLILVPFVVLCFLGFLLNNRTHRAQETRRRESQVTEKSRALADANQKRPANTFRAESAATQPATTATRRSDGDIMANAWLLVLKNSTSPKQYLSNADRPGPTIQPAPTTLPIENFSPTLTPAPTLPPLPVLPNSAQAPENP
jgi:hypothetical protein